MKKQLLLIIGIMISTFIYAIPLTSSQAKDNALSFLYRSNDVGRMFITAGSNKVTLTEVKLAESENAYYVYNIGDGNGFIIVSGDDCAEPVLGYSYTGCFDPEKIPANMKAWLDGYVYQITNIGKGTIMAAPQVRQSANKVPFRLPIPALLTCRWNQDSPYNEKCPNFNDGHGNRPTGCVATAVSQVMYYHKWPKQAVSEIPGYTYTDYSSLGGDDKDKTLEPLPSVKFDWDNMLDEYKRNSPAESCNAVATLMRYVGQSVQMNYCVKASGAHSSDIVSALRTYMGYDKGMKFVDRTGYSDMEWADIIYNELASKRPVLYSGTAPGVGGHQFICDGYENDFFHFNWGWGGISDGFFKLNALAPSDQGIGGAGNGMNFADRHHIVIGVQPSVEGSLQPEDVPCIGFLTLSDNNEGVYKKDAQGSLTININSCLGYNGIKDSTFSVGLGLFDSENQFKSVLKEADMLFETGYPNPKNNINGAVVFDKAQIETDGIYYVRCIVKPSSSSDWNIAEKGDKVFFKINVDGENVIFTQYPFVNVEIYDIHSEGYNYQNSEVVLKAKIKNTGEDLSGVMYLTHNKNVETSVSKNLDIKADEIKEIEFPFVPVESGELSFGISVNGRIFADEIKLDIQSGNNKNASIEFNPKRNITSGGNFMDVPLEITNQSSNYEYKSLVRAMLYTRAGFKYTKETSVVVPVSVDKKGSTTINLHFDNLKLGETYYLALAYYLNGREKVYGGINDKTGTPKKIFSKYITPDAISYYDESGAMSYKIIEEGETYDIPSNACYVELPKTVSGRTINRSTNPNCIYKLKKGASVNTLDGCNLLTEGISSELNLTDAYSYFCNEPIAVDKLNIKVRVDAELMALWLPFRYISAKIDGVELKQAGSLDEMAESDYMILPIVAEDEKTVYCDFAEDDRSLPCVMLVNKKHLGKDVVFSASNVSLNLFPTPIKGIFFNILCSNKISDYKEDVYGFTGKEFSSDVKKVAPFHIYLTSGSSSPAKVTVSFPEGFDVTGIYDVCSNTENAIFDIYTIDGVKVKRAVYGDGMLDELPSGLYIVNGKKFVK